MEDAEVSTARDYYRKILPFYEKESFSRTHMDFWTRIAREARPRRILEIGAGFGRITAALARVAPAVGLDVSLEMLLAARGRTSRARFLAADARRVAFGPVFDLIVAPGDPISHMTSLADRARALRVVTRQLAPDGVFVLEGLYRKRQDFALPKRTVRHPQGVLQIEEAWIPVGVHDLWHARYRYRDKRSDGSERRISAAFVARAWDPATIRALFAASGLAILDVWGGFDRVPFARGDARLIVRARRRDGNRPAEAAPAARTRAMPTRISSRDRRPPKGGHRT